MKKIKEVAIKAIRKIILFLKRMVDVSIKRLARVSSRLDRCSVPANPYLLDDLSPVDEIKNGEPYFKSLQWALHNNDICNIAVTGPYGSGKSSVIRSFEKQHPEYGYLHISLASFSDGASDKQNVVKEAPSKKGEEFIGTTEQVSYDEHRLVEISILQQIFYKVKSKSIPDSRFKRIKSLNNVQLISYTLLIVADVLSLFVLLYPGFLKKFPLWINFSAETIITLNYIAAGLLLLSIVLFTLYWLRFFRSRQFEKINIQSGEIAIKEDNEKSILNKHLDEIIYFFEVNRYYNVVIIEDLDRFKNHEIFTKLREINFLLNQSRQINRRIVFIYALKDDMFLDKTRAKFFDFIMPVIPVVNWNNSFTALHDKLTDKKLGLKTNEKFIRDITLYIDDMRILKNIFNEFIIYKENLAGLALDHNKLLGIIVYKNIYPTDFAKLHENKGMVYTVFQELKVAKTKQVKGIDDEIKKLEEKINKAKNEHIKNIHELRSVYIQHICDAKPATRKVEIKGSWLTSADIKSDENFELLRKELRIYVLSDSGSSSLNKTFQQIEKEVDAEASYDERVAAILSRSNGEPNGGYGAMLAKWTEKKSRLNSYSLKEFLDVHPTAIGSFHKEFLDCALLKYLLSEGYIDEMYTSMISYFYPGSLTQNDMDFLLSIKNQQSLDFVLPLSNVAEIEKGVTVIESQREAVLNFSFVNYLVESSIIDDAKLNSLCSAIAEKGKRHIEFMYAYLDNGKMPGEFCKAICYNWNGFWSFVVSDNLLTHETKDRILRLIITEGEITTIDKQDLDSSLSNYISATPYFFQLIPEKNYRERMKKVMDKLPVRFTELIPDGEAGELITHVYENNYYALNPMMTSFIISIFGKASITDEMLATASYSAIHHSGCDKLINYVEANINEFISQVYLTGVLPKKESKEIYLVLLQNANIRPGIKRKIVEHTDCLIDDIVTVPVEQWSNTIEFGRMAVTWLNVLRYYRHVNEINVTLGFYLNQPDNCVSLSANKIEYEQGTGDDAAAEVTAAKLQAELVQHELITPIAFERLVKSINLVFDSNLDFLSIHQEKITALILNDRLAMSPINYNALKQNSQLQLLLVSRNADVFISHMADYTLDIDDFINLLSSTQIANPKKLEIIQGMDESQLTGQEALADITASLVRNATFEIAYEKLKKILTYSSKPVQKVILLINQLEYRLGSEIDEVLMIMGEPYSLLAAKGKSPTISYTNEHGELVRKLQEIGYISSYNIDEKRERIRVNTKRVAGE